jgi:dihydrolipoamide dehydrogenase
MPDDFDLVVVGGGPGGYVAAIRAAQLGVRTAVVEKERPGGVCLNWGCIPTKAMLRSADVLETIQHSAEYGVHVDNVRLDYPSVIKRKDTVVKSLTSGVAGLLKANGVTMVTGHARFTGPNTLDVVDVGPAPLGAGGPLYNAGPGDGAPVAQVQGRTMMIATGSTPIRLPIPGVDLPGVITSDGAFMLQEVPGRIVIVGGSAVGAEWANMFHAFGAEVTIVEMLPRLVPAEDDDIGKALGTSFSKSGIDVVTGKTVLGIEEGKDSPLQVSIGSPGGDVEKTVAADVVLLGVGRHANTDGLDLEKSGVDLDRRGYVLVDDHMRTNVPTTYAIGDVTGRVLLAHVASHQGLIASGNIAGHAELMDYKSVPAATFTHPEIASVGMTERAARDSGYDVVTGKFPFAALGRAQTYGTTEGLVKIVAEKQYREVLGVHMIGQNVSDMITEGALALALEATLDDVADTIHAHPTLGEASMEASLVALGMPLHVAPPRRAK